MNYIVAFVALLLLFGCKSKPDAAEIKLKKYLMTQQIVGNQIKSNLIKREASKSANPRVLSAYVRSSEIISWRQKYYEDQSVESLLGYSDSVFESYTALSAMDKKIIDGIKTYREKVVRDLDSTSVLNLNWYTLYAEGALLEQCIRNMGSSFDYFQTTFPTSLSDSIVSPGDTVLVLVNTFNGLDDWLVNFDKVHCENEQSKNDISPHLTKLDNFYLLRYIPMEKGKYLIRGPVGISYGDFQEELPIANEFIVE